MDSGLNRRWWGLIGCLVFFTGWVMHRINYSGGLDVLDAVAESYERDAAWIERELGDVPVRVMGETCHDNPASWAGVLCEPPGRDA